MDTMTTATILWYRRDLRVSDHPALRAAAAHSAVAPVFILDDRLLQLPTLGSGRLWWLLQSLRSLSGQLEARGASLQVRRGEPAALLPEICRQVGATTVIAHRDHLPLGRQTEQRVADALSTTGCSLQVVDGLLAHPVGSITTSAHVYRVFAPFWRRWQDRSIPGPHAAPRSLNPAQQDLSSDLPTLADLGWPDPSQGVTEAAVGERAALRHLGLFLRERLSAYGDERNRPEGAGGSRLSPYLRYGLIGPRDFVWRVRRAAARSGSDPTPLLREFAFREYYAHRSSEWRTPTITRDAEQDERGRFDAWRSGRTGYPFVDAAMRELAATGWIGNRARLIVSTFFIHDLRLDFRLGERYFLQTLIDADPASNRGNWRWSAGIGPDAPPPWRTLNPVAQAKRYDPDGSYTRRWTPEVARFPARFVHEPWHASAAVQREAGCVLGHDYPPPIVPPRTGRARRSGGE